jgi:hypothetical protein
MFGLKNRGANLRHFILKLVDKLAINSAFYPENNY